MRRRINKVVVHHSAVDQPDMDKLLQSIQRTHKEKLKQPADKNWSHIAYHYIIWVDWDIRRTRDLDSVWRHASNLAVNKESIGICLSWNFDKHKPTREQYESLFILLSKLERKFNFTIHGHNEYADKTCPGNLFDMDKIYPENRTDIQIWLKGKLKAISRPMWEYLQTKNDCTRYASWACISTTVGKIFEEEDWESLKDYSEKRWMVIWTWANYITQWEITLDRWNTENTDETLQWVLVPLVSQDCKKLLAAWYRWSISRKTSREIIRDWIDWFFSWISKKFTWWHNTTIYFDRKVGKIVEVNSKYGIFERNKSTYLTNMKKLISRWIIKEYVIFFVKYK